MHPLSPHGPNRDPGPRDVNPLEEDIRYLESLAKNPKATPDDRRKLEQAIARLKHLDETCSFLTELGEQLGLPSRCRRLEDTSLASVVSDVIGNEEEPELSVALRGHLFRVFLEDRIPLDIQFFAASQLLFDVYAVALINELLRRQELREDADGRAVRELLVEKDERGERLLKLGKRAAEGRWFPGDPEEAPSLAREKIWEAVSSLASTEPAAANPEALLAFIRGDLNRILQHARDHVRTRIKTEHTRLGRLEFAEVHPAERLGEEQYGERLVEQLPDETQKDPDQKLLFEQLTSRAELVKKDRKLLELLLEGRTQKEAAATLGISQSNVSKRLDALKKKLAQIAGPQTNTGDKT